MKKTFPWLLLAVILLCGQFHYALAQEAEVQIYKSEAYSYSLDENGNAIISQWEGVDSELAIPSTLDGHLVTGIGYAAFYKCKSLIAITIPDSVTSIDDSAFAFCDSLTAITIPDSVTSIGANPFTNCESLTITISPDHPTFTCVDGVLFEKAEKKLICYPQSLKASAYQIPQGIKTIGTDAFSSCDSLISITIPDSVTSIGDSAFTSCKSLTAITIPDSVTSIGGRAFASCKLLTSLTIPDSVTSIGEGAFDGCTALTLTVNKDSYAMQYAMDNNYQYTYPDSLDWLTAQ